MYGVGVKALIIAVNRFNPSKGKSFGNYAILRIKGSLLDELRKIDHLPRANRAKAKSLQSTILELEAKFHRPPSDSEVANVLGLTDQEYRKLLNQTQPITFVPIDSDANNSGNDESSLSLHETTTIPLKQLHLKKWRKRKRFYIFVNVLKSCLNNTKKF